MVINLGTTALCNQPLYSIMSFHLQYVVFYSIWGRIKLKWFTVHCQKFSVLRVPLCWMGEGLTQSGGYQVITWHRSSCWADPMKRRGATANKATYGGDGCKYSKPLEEQCSHWLECEMTCGEMAKGDITIITGSSQEDIDGFLRILVNTK